MGRSRSESVRAETFESALQIRTSTVSAYVDVDFAFVLVHAFLPGRIQCVSRWAFAPVRSVRVDTFAAVARVRHEIAFVKVFAFVPAADAFGAQFRKRV